MKFKNIFLVVSSIVAGLGLVSTPLIAQDATRNSELVPLGQVLDAAAVKYDCYFTIEYNTTLSVENSVRSANIPNDLSISIKSFVKKLQTALPADRISIDSGNPKIIHIVDAGLSNKTGYPMSKVTSSKYTGPVALLPDAIGKSLGINLMTPTVYAANMSPSDPTTQVSTQEVSRPVRDILSDFVPLDHYSRIIWTSEIQNRKPSGEFSVWVTYWGKER
jgi:hypothetical protein